MRNTAKFTRKNLRYAMLLIALAEAVVTPAPSAKTMLIFLASLVALYFAGVAAGQCDWAKHPD
jgi:Sec-independent protein secretion pathway component TatC